MQQLQTGIRLELFRFFSPSDLTMTSEFLEFSINTGVEFTRYHEKLEDLRLLGPAKQDVGRDFAGHMLLRQKLNQKERSRHASTRLLQGDVG